MDLQLFGGIIAVFIIMSIVELVKNVTPQELYKYSGLLAVFLGLLISIGYTLLKEMELYKAVIVGMALGLSASGLYSITKSVKK